MEKMTVKLVLLLLAVIAIGMYAIPNTLAMYTGEPQLTSVARGGEVDCESCHGSSAKIYADLNKSSSAHSEFTCRGCHGFTNYTANSDDQLRHAATAAVSCVDCHADSVFFTSTIAVKKLNATSAAYKHRSETAGRFTGNDTDLDGPCIKCHMSVAVSAEEIESITESRKSDSGSIDLSRYTYGETYTGDV